MSQQPEGLTTPTASKLEVSGVCDLLHASTESQMEVYVPLCTHSMELDFSLTPKISEVPSVGTLFVPLS